MANKIIVQDTPITVIKQGAEDYICLTDMLQAKDGDFFVTDWLRNRNTLEYIGIWEKVYNPDFNYGEFATIRSQAGLNRFKISVKEFVARTNAISLQAKAGRYGGTKHQRCFYQRRHRAAREVEAFELNSHQADECPGGGRQSETVKITSQKNEMVLYLCSIKQIKQQKQKQQ